MGSTSVRNQGSGLLRIVWAHLMLRSFLSFGTEIPDLCCLRQKQHISRTRERGLDSCPTELTPGCALFQQSRHMLCLINTFVMAVLSSLFVRSTRDWPPALQESDSARFPRAFHHLPAAIADHTASTSPNGHAPCKKP